MCGGLPKAQGARQIRCRLLLLPAKGLRKPFPQPCPAPRGKSSTHRGARRAQTAAWSANGVWTRGSGARREWVAWVPGSCAAAASAAVLHLLRKTSWEPLRWGGLPGSQPPATSWDGASPPPVRNRQPTGMTSVCARAPARARKRKLQRNPRPPVCPSSPSPPRSPRPPPL